MIEVLVVVNVIVAVVAELNEQFGGAQHDEIFIGVLRHSPIPRAGRNASTFGDVHGCPSMVMNRTRECGMVT